MPTNKIFQLVYTFYKPNSPQGIVRFVAGIGLALIALPKIAYLKQRAQQIKFLHTELKDCHRVLGCYVRPYVHHKWSVHQRESVLLAHYRHLDTMPVPLWCRTQEWRDMFVLSSDYSNVRVVLHKPSWMRSEGEIGISLMVDRLRIVSVMLFFSHDEQGKTWLNIGAIQGNAKEETKEMVSLLTKQMHGLRPRDMIINLVKIIAANSGCIGVRAISDHAHRSQHTATTAEKESQYNAIWEDQQGIAKDDGFYYLSLDINKKDMEDIPSKKRSMYRKRYELLDHLESEMGNWLKTDPAKFNV